MKNIPCIILCGGKSSRMQKDKTQLDFGGQTLSEFMFLKLKNVFDEVFISAKEDKFNFKAPLILDKSPVFSPLIALENIFSHFKNDLVFIISVDYPFVEKRHILKLHDNLDDFFQIIIPKTPLYTHFLCGFYRTKISPFCHEMISQDMHKISLLSQKVSHKLVYFDDEKSFLNLNYPQDYETAKIVLKT